MRLPYECALGGEQQERASSERFKLRATGNKSQLKRQAQSELPHSSLAGGSSDKEAQPAAACALASLAKGQRKASRRQLPLGRPEQRSKLCAARWQSKGGARSRTLAPLAHDPRARARAARALSPRGQTQHPPWLRTWNYMGKA